ncbi:hypothetical protein GCM10023331_12350 [Algivirga pacifica]|uniref:DUF6436 domain-containing protein n=2 Tax=Algivirga pacifica TaxID=1162670 RepID=A0ABP9D4G5_9BACT
MYLFWKQEYQFTQPTPIPEGFQEAEVGKSLDFQNTPLDGHPTPMFIHYFNDECPCSQFNLKSFRQLYQQYKDSLHFVVVVEHGKSIESIAADFPKGIELISDTPDAHIAVACGVYATPQAIIVDEQQHLYYKGNFNKARYCTQKGSNYALLATEQYLAGSPPPFFGWSAVQAYGCSLSIYDSTQYRNPLADLYSILSDNNH